MNFVALAIIAEFDDFIYSGGIKELDQKAFAVNEDDDAPIKKILTIRHTTSSQCGDEEPTTGVSLCFNEKEGPHEHKEVKKDHDEEEQHLMRVNFWMHRSCSNKLCYIIYKLYRVVYVSMYYYFFPYFILFGAFLLPYLASKGILGGQYFNRVEDTASNIQIPKQNLSVDIPAV
jgi:hypothetical protein